MGNPLWDYSLATYSLDEVAAACLALQDTFGIDVNLLLYAAWLAHLDRRLTDSHLTELEALIADWRDKVVMPLRAVRRHLLAYPDATGLRNDVKSLELCAEREQQDLMYAFYQQATELAPSNGSLSQNLSLVAQFAGHRDERLITALGRLAALIHAVKRG
jgi:uncharacterized protein (TIGR02444 family)